MSRVASSTPRSLFVDRFILSQLYIDVAYLGVLVGQSRAELDRQYRA